VCKLLKRKKVQNDVFRGVVYAYGQNVYGGSRNTREDNFNLVATSAGIGT